ncbi:MAG TPA: hypothetical protein PLN45_06310, partial [Exilispira sp.]|nr:hypothetical protein [Exilispira sp.]
IRLLRTVKPPTPESKTPIESFCIKRIYNCLNFCQETRILNCALINYFWEIRQIIFSPFVSFKSFAIQR